MWCRSLRCKVSARQDTVVWSDGLLFASHLYCVYGKERGK
jgi:hypothetical protein